MSGRPTAEPSGDPTPNVVSFYMETSAGGIPITLCSCGVLIYQPMAALHVAGCEVCRDHLQSVKP